MYLLFVTGTSPAVTAWPQRPNQSWNITPPHMSSAWPLTSRSCLVSHGGGASGSASGDEAAGLAQGTVHQVPGALQAAKQTHPTRRDPCQGHAGKTYTHTHTQQWLEALCFWVVYPFRLCENNMSWTPWERIVKFGTYADFDSGVNRSFQKIDSWFFWAD